LTLQTVEKKRSRQKIRFGIKKKRRKREEKGEEKEGNYATARKNPSSR
jgi:hypothetical protein